MHLTLANFWLPEAITWRLLAPELALIAAIVALLVAPLVVGRDRRTCVAIALGGAGSALGLALLALREAAAPTELFAAPLDVVGTFGPGVLVSDALSAFFRLFIAAGLLVTLALWALADAADETHPIEFLVLLLASAVGMMLMSGAVNLLLMIIAIELASLPSYLLAAFDRRRRNAAEAGLKYVMFGATCSGIAIYGVSLLFGMFGTLHVPTLVARIAEAPLDAANATLLALALLAVFTGIGFKISAVPFHTWCPDVFEGASISIATWLSFASKGAGVVLLLRLVRISGEPLPSDGSLALGLASGIAAFAIVTCTFANLAAYRQTSVRRLLAYSSIAHAGYMLAAAAVALGPGSAADATLSAVLQYLLVYLLMNLGAFVCLALVALDSGSEQLDAFTGLGWRDASVALSMTLCLVSLIGLPPLGGFIVKWWLIYGLGSAASGPLSAVMWTLVFAVVINTAISLFYYARIVRQMYLRGQDQAAALRAPFAGRALLHACAVLLLLTGTLLAPGLKREADRVVAALTSPTPPISVARP